MDEEKLTADALWEAVTGKAGAQTWYESVHITCRSPEAEAARKAENERIYAPRRERAEKAKTEPATEAQVKYQVIKGSDIAPRAPQQRCATAAKRLTKARARKLITALVGHDRCLAPRRHPHPTPARPDRREQGGSGGRAWPREADSGPAGGRSDREP
ncbi:hypothetical protein [Streptomyces galilaeus]|uniref:hypothetical protein n=1 Tax=Streptomyces galilaeus TaxID=33899 RepID=UPI0038F6285F